MALSTISTNYITESIAYTPPTPDIISITDLLNDHEVAVNMEAADLQIITDFFNPTMESLRSYLLDWARKGFPMGGDLLKRTLNPPRLCSDGQQRTLPFYIEYVTGKTLPSLLAQLNAKTTGMTFLYSWDGNTITLRVNKD